MNIDKTMKDMNNFKHLDLIKISIKAHKEFIIPKTHHPKTIEGVEDAFIFLENILNNNFQESSAMEDKYANKKNKEYKKGVDLALQVWQDVWIRTKNRFDGTMEDRELLYKI
jgi:hypothetical protein